MIATMMEVKELDAIFLGAKGKEKFVDSSKINGKKDCVREEPVTVTTKTIFMIISILELSKTFGMIHSFLPRIGPVLKEAEVLVSTFVAFLIELIYDRGSKSR
ncbi:hypothetical protein V6N13_110903 [Hibiscus sabdariffa]|uniref:Uncharacterized protein n=1 Tax=Hibiscus sabdariffa TaxID=183260 RepID=A0ABR2TJ98_9ROSI